MFDANAPRRAEGGQPTTPMSLPPSARSGQPATPLSLPPSARSGFGSASAGDLTGRRQPPTFRSTSSSVMKRLPYGTGHSGFLESTDPDSQLRRSAALLPQMDMRTLWDLRLRANGTNVDDKCATLRKLGINELATETTSAATLQDKRRKHMRSTTHPNEKFAWGAATSHEIGWHTRQDDVRQPRFPRMSSGETKYFDNMKATNMEAALRMFVSKG